MPTQAAVDKRAKIERIAYSSPIVIKPTDTQGHRYEYMYADRILADRKECAQKWLRCEDGEAKTYLEKLIGDYNSLLMEFLDI